MGALDCSHLFSMKKNILFFAFFFATNSLAANFAYHSSWLKLLRYKKTFSGHESEVTNLRYFISNNGRFNPVAELEETRSSLLKKEFSKDHTICRFPARAKLLQRYEGIELPFSFEKCQKFQKFKHKINLESVSLIFSSYFIHIQQE